MTLPLWAAFLFWYVFGALTVGMGIVAWGFAMYKRGQQMERAASAAQKGGGRV